MADGLTTDLLWAAFCIWLFGVWVTSRTLSLAASIPIATVKVAIPLLYFAFFNQRWTFLDDMSYLQRGATLLHSGYTPLNILTPRGIILMEAVAEGEHFLYYWWNLLGQYWFGVHYYSAVFLNVGLTFVCGNFLFQLLQELGFDAGYRRLCQAFFLVQWDVLAWSSLVNLKDILAMTLTTMGLFFLVRVIHQLESRRLRMPTLGALILVMLIFSGIRFYIPLIFLATAGLWLLFQMRGRRRWWFVAAAAIAMVFVLQKGSGSFGHIQPSEMVSGLFHFPLTPLPWNVEDDYSFLVWPSAIHWALFLPMVYAGVCLWRQYPPSRVPLLYLLLMMAMYAVIPELSGPRHRVQITAIIAWLQFHFFWMLTHDVRMQARSHQNVIARDRI